MFLKVLHINLLEMVGTNGLRSKIMYNHIMFILIIACKSLNKAITFVLNFNIGRNGQKKLIVN